MEEVGGAPAAIPVKHILSRAGLETVSRQREKVPEIGGRVFICDEHDGESGVRGRGEDGEGGGGVMLGGMRGEGLEERFPGESGVSELCESSIKRRDHAHEVFVLGLKRVTLDCGCFLYNCQRL